MNCFSYDLDVMNGTKDVGGMRARDHGCFLREQFLEIRCYEFWVLLRLWNPPFDCHTKVLSHRNPRGNIGFMVDFGDDDF